MRDNTFGPVAGGTGNDDVGPSAESIADVAVDLSALRAAPPRWEALAARVEAAAAPELARRAALGGGGVFDLVPLLARALRPALVAAAAALLAGVGLSRGATSTRTATVVAVAEGDDVAAEQLVSDASVARALQVREADAAWLAEGPAPSPEALARAIGLTAAAGDAAEGNP